MFLCEDDYEILLIIAVLTSAAFVILEMNTL